MLLTETFDYQIGTIKTKNGNNMRVAYIDANRSQSTYDLRKKIQEFGAKWYGPTKWWYWVLGNDPEGVIRNQVQPCMEFLSTKEDMGGGPKRDIVASIDKLIAKVKGAKMPNTGGANTKDDILSKLEGFKADLVRITSDDEFKQKMGPLIKFRNANNYQYSLINTILILIQDPQATLVKAGGAWRDYYGRKVKPGSKSIMMWIPKGEKNRDEEEKIRITNDFLAKKRVKSVKELSAPDKERLDKHLNKTVPQYFDLAPYWYDWRFTEQMDGTEDVLGNPGSDIQWFDDSGEETPELVQHIDALIEVIQEKGIQFNFVDDLGGARGVSKSGTIDVLRNQPKNAGMFNTITHEFAHEILHQRYLQSKDEEMKGYFVGTEEGRSKVEQQAELCAWIVLRSFGYDMPTNINYVGIWGLNQDNAVRVFDSVSSVATYISKKINQKERGEETDMFESKQYLKEGEIPSGYEIAQMVGCGKVYQRAARKIQQNSNVVRVSQDELTEMIKNTVASMINEGKLGDFAQTAWNKAKETSDYVGDMINYGYQKREGNPQSVRDVFEGNGWKLVSIKGKDGKEIPNPIVKGEYKTYIVEPELPWAFGSFDRDNIGNIIRELNLFTGNNNARYLDTVDGRWWWHKFVVRER